MLPLPFSGGQSPGQALLTLVLTLVPALITWWNDRSLLPKADDPALPELLANRRRLNVRTIAIAVALMIVFGGADAAWGVPVLIVLLIAVAYPLRTRVLGETWGFGAYLWYTSASIIGGFGFWIALSYAPTVMRWIVESIGTQRPWHIAISTALAAVVVVLLVAWEAWYPRIWLSAHAARRLESAELTPRFDEIVRRAGTIVPAVYRVGPQGSRFVNAMALPSVRRPSVAMGNALLDLLDPDETAAIFAHEVAHFDHLGPRYVRRSQLINRVLIVTGVALPLLAAFAGVGWAKWIGWVWPFIVLVALGRRAAKSQQHETESDLRAAALCGDPEALVRGLVKLHAHARIPRRYDVDLERAASHPSLVRRIQAIRAGGTAAIEQLGAATVIRSAREGSWVVLEDTRAYWLDGVPEGTDAQLAALRDASSSYRAVNYQDLVELRVTAIGDARTITARGRAGDRWSVPIATEDVARVQRALDVVDLRLGKAGPAPARVAPKAIALAAFAVTFFAGQTGVVLVPIVLAMWKPSAAALASLGAMSIVRAAIGSLEGTSWLDVELVRVGLAALALVGAFAIYTAVRLVRAGGAKANLRLTMSVLLGLAAVTGAAVVVQIVRMRSVPLAGAPAVGAFATALFGVAAALFTLQARWSRPAAYTGLALASLIAVLGFDRRSMALRHALAEATARATPESETQLGGQAYSLRVSPDGHHFLALQTPTYRPGVRARATLVTGRVGGRAREVAGADAEFVDDARLLTVAALDRGVELRIESADSSGVLWADTLSAVTMPDLRLTIDRDHGSWVIIGTDEDNDRTAVFTGRINEKGATLRAPIPDTIPISGEPIVFDDGATLIFPSYPTVQRSARGQPVPALSLLSLPFFGVDLPAMELWRAHGDSVRSLTSVRGAPQCGEALGGRAACAVHRLNATSLYTVSASGDVEEVAQLSINEFRLAGVGPGLWAASGTFDREIVVIDLAAKRLTRVELPPNQSFASEVRAGPGWAVTLGYGQNQRSVVRSYRIQQ